MLCLFQDLPSTDRSGLAVRLVRKTKTNFLLSSTKKSRKPKAPVPPNEAAAPNASGRHGSHSHKELTSSGLPEELKKGDRKREHIKPRENPAVGKPRKENSKSKARSSLRKMKSERSSKGPVIPRSYSGSNKGLPLKVRCSGRPYLRSFLISNFVYPNIILLLTCPLVLYTAGVWCPVITRLRTKS